MNNLNQEHRHNHEHANDQHDNDHHHSDDHNHANDYDNEFDIYPQEFLGVFNNVSSFKCKIIDVREPWEVEEVKIAGSLSIPLQQLNQQVKQLQPDHAYYVICTQGFRSSYATAYLLSLGFENVYNIQTGLMGIIKHLGGEKNLPVWLIRGGE